MVRCACHESQTQRTLRLTVRALTHARTHTRTHHPLHPTRYADGDVELSVPKERIRAQKFSKGETVEVNSGGKGIWHECKVLESLDGQCKVEHLNENIRWVTDESVGDKPLCTYGLVGWIVAFRGDGNITVRRPPQRLGPRGFAVTRRRTQRRILPVQVLESWVRVRVWGYV